MQYYILLGSSSPNYHFAQTFLLEDLSFSFPASLHLVAPSYLDVFVMERFAFLMTVIKLVSGMNPRVPGKLTLKVKSRDEANWGHMKYQFSV